MKHVKHAYGVSKIITAIFNIVRTYDDIKKGSEERVIKWSARSWEEIYDLFLVASKKVSSCIVEDIR